MRLIDADALDFEEVEEEYGSRNPAVVACEILIDEASTVEAEPVKQGKWLNMERIEDDKAECITEWQQAQCSVCHKWHTTPYMYFFMHYNYCPHCGVKMEGKINEIERG